MVGAAAAAVNDDASKYYAIIHKDDGVYNTWAFKIHTGIEPNSMYDKVDGDKKNNI
jgi:hypothetical protein